jgi:hypothetical protein
MTFKRTGEDQTLKRLAKRVNRRQQLEAKRVKICKNPAKDESIKI